LVTQSTTTGNIMTNKTLVAAAIAAALSFSTLPTRAATNVWVRAAPPELRVEEVPAARAGYQWAPGYWNWQGQRHVWHSGNWVRERRGYTYRQPQWVERNGRWQQQRGQWSRRMDSDGDGVPNSQDRHPTDPNRH
jgi:hypothetical protein